MIGKWVVKTEKLPTLNDVLVTGGYFYVRKMSDDGWITSMRLFDDSSKTWFIPTNKGFEQNNAFDEWHQIEGHYKVEPE